MCAKHGDDRERRHDQQTGQHNELHGNTRACRGVVWPMAFTATVFCPPRATAHRGHRSNGRTAGKSKRPANRVCTQTWSVPLVGSSIAQDRAIARTPSNDRACSSQSFGMGEDGVARTAPFQVRGANVCVLCRFRREIDSLPRRNWALCTGVVSYRGINTVASRNARRPL